MAWGMKIDIGDHVDHDVDDEQKVNRVYEIIEDVDWDDVLTQFERGFIYENYQKCQATDYIFNEKQSKIIDEIYEKCYQAGCFN